jgi:hypothetical protein
MSNQAIPSMRTRPFADTNPAVDACITVEERRFSAASAARISAGFSPLVEIPDQNPTTAKAGKATSRKRFACGSWGGKYTPRC